MSERSELDHAGDLLSALLDDELTEAEAAEVRDHIARCGECARELDDVREARQLLRGLPAVDPPAAFLAEMLAGDVVVPLAPRRRRTIAFLAAGSVAAGLLIVAIAMRDPSSTAIEPEVASAVERHASTERALERAGGIRPGATRFDSPGSVAPTTSPPRAVDDLPAALGAPAMLAGYELVEAYEANDGVHLFYRRGSYGLSIFQTEGEPDWDTLPADGTRLRIAGHDAWRWDDVTAAGRLYVIDDDDVVVTVIADQPGDAVLDVIAELLRS